VHDGEGNQQCRHWEPHTPDFDEWEQARHRWLQQNVKVPLSSPPVWCDSETLREECSIRCCSQADEKKLKQYKTMEKMEGFLLARCRGGCQLTSNVAQGVRTCNVDIVREDLKERGLHTRNMNEAEQRKVTEATLRLEDEAKRMKVLRRDKRFEEGRGVSTDIGT
jgi:hypothetical protein